LKLGAKKIPGGEKFLEDVFNEAETIYIDRKEVRESFLKEQEAERRYIIESEGRYSELSKTERVWRTLMRPLLTVSVVGSFILIIWISIFQNILGSRVIIHAPDTLVMFSKWIVAFWFCSRGAEKLFTILKGGKSA